MSRQGPNPFGPREPDLDELKAQGAKVARALGVGLVVGAVLFGLASMAYTVQPEERAIVTRFGRVVRLSDPGLHFKLPFGIERTHRVATERILKQEFGFRTLEAAQRTQYSPEDFNDESLMLTGDLNVINVEWVVQYRITNPEQYLFRGMREGVETLRDISESVMQQVIGNRLGSDALTVGRVEIASVAQERMQAILDGYNSGITILRVELQDVTPPDSVKPSFNEVNEARQERERMINEAERARNETIPRALGEARQAVAQAQGYAAVRVNRARGEATRFLELAQAYGEAPEVTRQRLFLEMIDKVMPQIGQVFVVEGGQSAPLPIMNLTPGTHFPTDAAKGAAR
ncbi:MAG: FtsH protease activity modulator HflK [Candidatus Sumerlaeia bacterium]|nr:FtsH protease activity modulator HflK [Candidatus Sumerlaeia bacterium]